MKLSAFRIKNISNYISKKKKNKHLDKMLEGSRHTEGKYIDEHGFVFHYPDEVSFAWTYKELFEKKVYYFKTNDNKVSPLIIDCGANIGLSVIYFKKIYPNCKIIAFEPDPFLFKYLKKNLKDNLIDNVEVIQKAVWHEETKLQFYHEKSDSGRLNLNEDSNISKIDLIEVETCLLSSYMEQEVDFLKIDIEGAESKVVEEISHNLKNVNKTFIESHSFKNTNQDLHNILKILFENNFRYYLTEGAVVSPNPFLKKKSFLNMDLQVNIHAHKN